MFLQPLTRRNDRSASSMPTPTAADHLGVFPVDDPAAQASHDRGHRLHRVRARQGPGQAVRGAQAADGESWRPRPRPRGPGDQFGQLGFRGRLELARHCRLRRRTGPLLPCFAHRLGHKVWRRVATPPASAPRRPGSTGPSRRTPHRCEGRPPRHRQRAPLAAGSPPPCGRPE